MSQVHIFTNADKDGWRKQIKNTHPNELTPASRILIAGQPNSGKTNILKQLIVNSPAFDKIFIKKTHHLSNEFEEIYHTCLNSFEEFSQVYETDKSMRVLVILEDTNYMSTKDAEKVEALFSFFASHYGWVVVVVSQTPFSIPVNIRRLLDTFFIFSGGCTRIVDSLPVSCSHKGAIKSIVASKLGKHQFIKIDCGKPLSDRYSINFATINILDYI